MDGFIKKRISKAQSIVDFNYNMRKNKNPRKSMFQILSPSNNSRNLINQTPKDIYNANNNINSILSKNLESIYNENKNDELNQDSPLFENVDSLIKKNKNSNRHLYKKFISIKNNGNNIKHSNKELNKNSKKKFQSGEIIHLKRQTKNDTVINNSNKNTLDIAKKLDFISYNNQESFHKIEYMTPNNRSAKNQRRILGIKKSNFSMLSNFQFDKKPQISKAKAFLAKRHNSLVFHPIHNEKAKLKSCFNNDKLKKPLLNKKSVKGILNKKRWSVDSNNSSKKRGSKSIPKLKKRRNSLFVDSPKKNMIIPTLSQINRTINKTLYLDSLMNKKRYVESYLFNLTNNVNSSQNNENILSMAIGQVSQNNI